MAEITDFIFISYSAILGRSVYSYFDVAICVSMALLMGQKLLTETFSLSLIGAVTY